jgi:hypothetical protein
MEDGSGGCGHEGVDGDGEGTKVGVLKTPERKQKMKKMRIR